MAYNILTRLLVFVGFLSLSCLATADNIVDTGYAKYRGNVSYPNVVAFLGIPYAEPPIGDRRFRAPLPLNTARVSAQARGSVLDATSYPQFCIQGTTGQGDAGGAGSEDCLTVNVYAPLGARPSNKLPVLVYIHGGGYTYGNPANWPFDHWVHQIPEVVVVSVYYRLDAFGFLAHPAFANSPTLGDLNVGLLDQTEALRWIQRNIGAFGGEPSRVTINGQSAGGSSVELHLVAPQSSGLFSQAIGQSVYRTPLPTPEQQQPLFEFFAERAGCGSGPVTEQMRCLRSVPISALAPAQDAPFNGSFNAFHPVFDGKIITTRPTASILSGKFQRANVIVGATSNESLSGGTDLRAPLKSFFPLLTDQDLDEFVQQYPLSDFDSASQQVRVGTGESQLRCAAEIIGGAFSKERETKAFVYRYNTANPTSGSTTVDHSADNWMMFRGTNTGFNGTTMFSTMTPSEEAFAEELIAYWLSFVRTGDPNTFKLSRSPTWPAYSTTKTQRIVLTEGTVSQSGSSIEIIPSLESQRCAFVASKAAVQQD